MIKDKLDSGCFAVAVRDKFPECAAPVNAVEMYVADLSESLQLLFVLKPDNKFITGNPVTPDPLALYNRVSRKRHIVPRHPDE